MRDDLAAVRAGSRPHVDDIVRRADRLLVVLDNEHAVAHVGQAPQRADEFLVVSRMQSDRRFVKNITDPDQAAADLRCQPDPLRLAAGKRRARPIQGQVPEPDIDQEAKALLDLLENLLGDRRRFSPQRKRLKELI